jgi:hypothetical protein
MALDENFKNKIDSLAAGDQSGTPTDPAAPPIRKRGRPAGSTKAAKEAQAAPIQAPVPPVNEMEAELFAKIFAGAANMFIKKEYKDKLNFTPDEFLTITRPAVQLKAYYMPSLGGIYSIWLQFGLAAGAMGLAKYKIINEIMQNERPREETNLGIGDQGNRQVDESKGNIVDAQTHTDL